jgi:hypothetical protein
MESQGLARTLCGKRRKAAVPANERTGASGFAVKKRAREAGIDPWWQTITHYMPEPWLIAWKNRRAFSRP